MGWGAAALHPSMRALSIATPDTRRFHRGRLALIVSAVLVPPAMLFIQDARGDVTDAMAIAVASTVLFVLVLIRTSGLARDAADVKRSAFPCTRPQRVRRHRRAGRGGSRTIPDAVDRAGARADRDGTAKARNSVDLLERGRQASGCS